MSGDSGTARGTIRRISTQVITVARSTTPKMDTIRFFDDLSGSLCKRIILMESTSITVTPIPLKFVEPRIKPINSFNAHRGEEKTW
jgi:hypothetical protein